MSQFLSEAVFHLESSAYVLSLVEDGLLQVRSIVPRTSRNSKIRRDAMPITKPDLADLCLIRMSERYPRHSVITVDEATSVYRRNNRETNPLICPPPARSGR